MNRSFRIASCFPIESFQLENFRDAAAAVPPVDVDDEVNQIRRSRPGLLGMGCLRRHGVREQSTLPCAEKRSRRHRSP